MEKNDNIFNYKSGNSDLLTLNKLFCSITWTKQTMCKTENIIYNH